MKKVISLVLLISIFTISCKVNYSFSGASISSDIKSFSVNYFTNTAVLAPPSLNQTFTEDLKNVFLSQTSLKLTTTDADLLFEGVITGYDVSPVAVTGNELAAKNRLTMRVQVKFVNTKDAKQNFDQSFSRFYDFESSQSLTSVEQALIKEINAQLVQDIFNASVGNW